MTLVGVVRGGCSEAGPPRSGMRANRSSGLWSGCGGRTADDDPGRASEPPPCTRSSILFVLVSMDG